MHSKTHAGQSTGPESGLIQFRINRRQIRCVIEGGEVEMVAKDLVAAIGSRWNGAAAVEHVPAQWRKVRSVLTTRGRRETHTLTEEGANFYLARSDKPGAVPFLVRLTEKVSEHRRNRSPQTAPHVRAADTDKERAIWLVEQVLKRTPAARVLKRLLPKGDYGAPAKNGHLKTGFRSCCWTAQPHREAVAAEIAGTLPLIGFVMEVAGDLKLERGNL